jgi:hypothetical protein
VSPEGSWTTVASADASAVHAIPSPVGAHSALDAVVVAVDAVELAGAVSSPAMPGVWQAATNKDKKRAHPHRRFRAKITTFASYPVSLLL